jgi:hypothetical protein
VQDWTGPHDAGAASGEPVSALPFGVPPYLGPDPPRSRPAGRLLVGLAVAAGLSKLVVAGLYFQRATLDGRIPAQGIAAVRESLNANTDQRVTAGNVSLALLVAALVINVVWHQRRRPPAELKARGEAYVEAPTRVFIPVWCRFGGLGFGLLTLLAFSLGRVTTKTTATELVTARTWTAVGSVTFALIMFSLVPWVVLSERFHARRLAASGPYRAHPETVPFVPPASKR